jgi:hypothetical protein
MGDASPADCEPGAVRRYPLRMNGFVLGDQVMAEDIAHSPNPQVVKWMQEAKDSTDLVDYAREVSRAGFDQADAALKGLQTKAGSMVTTVLTLGPIAFAVSGVGLASLGETGWAKWSAFILFCLVDLSLVGAGLLAFLASGLVLTGAVNPENLLRRAPSTSVNGLKLAGADSWYYAMVVTNWSGKRVATDLFHSRQLVEGRLTIRPSTSR